MSAKPHFIRFVVHRKHWRSGERCGLFQAINDAIGAKDQPSHVRDGILELAAWFNANLRTPFLDPNNHGRQPSWKIEPQARSISWVKLDAVEHVSKLFHLKSLMEEAGWLVEELRTAKPGVILYEDEFQVVAIPYADTPT